MIAFETLKPSNIDGCPEAACSALTSERIDTATFGDTGLKVVESDSGGYILDNL